MVPMLCVTAIKLGRHTGIPCRNDVSGVAGNYFQPNPQDEPENPYKPKQGNYVHSYPEVRQTALRLNGDFQFFLGVYH
jgi:hypothetical protein